MDLNTIKDPSFLKSLSIDELKSLSKDIRTSIIDTVSKKGGHLSSNLGDVEATVALHYVFDSPKDKILFDVGHQCYTHKILTGRYNDFCTSLREKDGLAGYQKRNESVYDCFEAGHSSTSISAAMGMKKGMMINKIDGQVIAFIGDSSISSGMAFEALNNLSDFDGKVIVVLNDNGMAISKPTGGLSKKLSEIRNSFTYNHTKSNLKVFLYAIPLGKYLYKLLSKIKNVLKRGLLGNNIFDNLNLDYFGPIDGHNIEKLIKAFRVAKENDKSCVVHIVTKKGYGYDFSEKDEDGIWHGVSPFEVQTGHFYKEKKKGITSWSEAISTIVYDLMKKDEQIVTITPAMIEGSKLRQIKNDFKDRFYDVNIAEEHAATFAGGMALGDIKPYFTVYSTFMQRAYDQISHDIARMNLGVVIGVDRAGLVGQDGTTHQGIYDVAYLKSIPNVVISMPKDMCDAKKLYNTGFNNKVPFVIRYPRDDVNKIDISDINDVYEIGTWDKDETSNAKLNVIVTGPKYNELKKLKDEYNLPINLYFARFYNPLDYKMMDNIIDNKLNIMVYDCYSTKLGLYNSIIDYCINKTNVKFINKSIENEFIKHATIKEQEIELGLDIESIYKDILNEIR